MAVEMQQRLILGGIGVWVARMIWKERRVDTPH